MEPLKFLFVVLLSSSWVTLLLAENDDAGSDIDKVGDMIWPWYGKRVSYGDRNEEAQFLSRMISALRSSLWRGNGKRDAQQRDDPPFWAARGKKSAPAKTSNDPNAPFWAARGKKDGEMGPFWASRGKRFDELNEVMAPSETSN